MREETPEHKAPLRSGLTTGACACATALAAARVLLCSAQTEEVEIRLPRGQSVRFHLERCRRDGQQAEAATIKDAGDDPDVTHGALVFSRVALDATPGVRFHAGSGVGTVTRPGLALAVGEPAINPVPRQMIAEHLQRLAEETRYPGGFEVTVGVEHGEVLALKTMNPRLGIVGGLSILGTTGIVRPFSCSAYIASIQQGIDVARANGLTTVAATTGSTSEQAIRNLYGLPEMALIEMGDFVGAVLKHLKRAPLDKLILCGGFGKLSKLACGHLDLHSRKSSIDFGFLAQEAITVGASSELAEAVRHSNTSLEALALCQQAGLNLGNRICALAQSEARRVVSSTVQIEVWAVDKHGNFVGRAMP